VNVSGQHHLAVPRTKVWDALREPAVLAGCVPGCARFERRDTGRYEAALDLAVASRQGTYLADIEVVDTDAPSSVTLRLAARGEPGTIRGQLGIVLEEDRGGTQLRHTFDAEVDGAIAMVGQRLLAGALQRVFTGFATALEQELTAGGEPSGASAEARTGEAGEPSGASAGSHPTAVAEAGVGEHVEEEAAEPVVTVIGEGRHRAELLVAAAIGGAITLLVVVLTRRQRS
jgi:uncharacterized protein